MLFSSLKKSAVNTTPLNRKQDLLDANRHLLGSDAVELRPQRMKKNTAASSQVRRDASPVMARPGARGIVLPAIFNKMSSAVDATKSKLLGLKNVQIARPSDIKNAITSGEAKYRAVTAVFPGGRGRLRGAMAPVPALLLSLLMVGACLGIGLATMNLDLTVPLRAVGLGNLIGLGMRRPAIDRWAFKGVDLVSKLVHQATGQTLFGGSGNAAWFRSLSKGAVPYPWEHGALKNGILAALYGGLVFACFRLLTAQVGPAAASRRKRLVALGTLAIALANKSLWAVARLGFRSTVIGLAHRVVSLALAIASTATAARVDRKAAIALALVTAWTAWSAGAGALLWYRNL